MTALLTVAGISIASEMIAKLMEEYGQGSKVVFIKIAAYIACGYVAFDFWWDGVRYVASTFGVHI
jgi:hypothetical protein